MRIEEAIEVFGAGFTFTRSWTHPYLFDRVGPLWRLHDAPRKRPTYRGEEWLVYGTDAVEADRIVKANASSRFAVCVFQSSEQGLEAIKSEWKGIGYRYHGSERLFVHDLEELPDVECAYRIERITTQALADQLTKVHRGHRQIRSEHLAENPPRFRVWVAFDGHEIVGWVRSGFANGSTWCSNMGVLPSHRRQGIAKGLLAQMLASDKSLGANSAVLLASHAGAMLYPHVGYEAIGELLIFSPVVADKQKSGSRSS